MLHHNSISTKAVHATLASEMSLNPNVMLRKWKALRTVVDGGLGGPVLLPSLSVFLIAPAKSVDVRSPGQGPPFTHRPTIKTLAYPTTLTAATLCHAQTRSRQTVHSVSRPLTAGDVAGVLQPYQHQFNAKIDAKLGSSVRIFGHKAPRSEVEQGGK